jgi:hypothetical protein
MKSSPLLPDRHERLAGSLLMLPLAIALIAGCSRRLHIPNASMTAEPGPIQLAYKQVRYAEGEFQPCEADSPDTGVTEIAIEWTSCYGYCPCYTYTARADGSAKYIGRANVAFKGQRSGSIDPDAFQAVAAFAIDIGFFNTLENSYSCAVTCQETAYLSLLKDGERKIIKHDAPDYAGPPRLRGLEWMIRRLEELTEWDD